MRTIAVSQQECEELLQRITADGWHVRWTISPMSCPLAFPMSPVASTFFPLSVRRLNACGRILKSACKPTRSGMIRTG